MHVEMSANGKLISLQSAENTRSEAVSEIISQQPGILVRYGTTIFLAIIVLALSICWFIPYPDIVNARVKLTSINAPKPIISRIDGKLISLKVKESDNVNQNDIIGYIESTANHQRVIQLSGYLDSLIQLTQENRIDEVLYAKNINFNDLGELQPFFQNFSQAFTTFSNYFADGFYVRKKALLEFDKKRLLEQHGNLLIQKQLQEKDLSLAQKTFDASDTLKKQKVISDLEYRNEQSKLLNKQLIIPQINLTIISNENSQADKQKEIFELENSIAQQKLIFLQVMNTFKSEIEDWKKKYLLIAPMNGKIMFGNFLQENQQLHVNDIICFVKPANNLSYAEMFIPQECFGKVKTGQIVLLKFAAYPDAEFGSVKGTIDFISNVSTDSGYLAKVSLPDDLVTNYHKHINFRDGLIANGQIITQDMRLLERLYYNIYKQFKQ